VTLSEAERARYSRQLLLDDWSRDAQERLKSARAMVIGAGALGSPVATYLVAAGVGSLGVVDGRVVEFSSLQRQPLFMTPDVGAPKADVAAIKLGLLNPEVIVEAFPAELNRANAEAIVLGADVVVDCTGGSESRYLVNDACCAQGIPLVEARVLGFDGLVLSIRPGESACYRCAFPAPAPPTAGHSAGEAGTLGAMAGIVGSIQALEALKLLSGVGEPLLDSILHLDGRNMRQTLARTSRSPGCQACAPE
jgi:adenylyltransferase/sulfurtransferase